jgi:cell division protein FtsB
MRRAVRALVVAVAVGGILLLFVFPGRTWLSQSRASDRARRQLATLSQENAALAKRIAQLQNSAYIEQIARQQYGLVLPGEQAYGILPTPTTTTTVPSTKHHG